jgi:histidine kinase
LLQGLQGPFRKCDVCPVLKTFEDGRPHYSEEAAVNKDGTETYWMVKTSPIKNSKGEVIAAMEMSLDLTQVRFLEREARRSEEKYRTIFDTIPNPVFVLDAQDLTILDCNHSVTPCTDFTRTRSSRPPFSIFSANERESYETVLQSTNIIDRARQVRKDGNVIYVNMRISHSEYWTAAKVLLVTTSDITLRLMAEQQLIQASKMATLGEMATGVAHELNQPLSVIKTASSFLRRKMPGERSRSRKTSSDYGRRNRQPRGPCIKNHQPHEGIRPQIGGSEGKGPGQRGLETGVDFFKQQLKLREIEVVEDLEEDLPAILADSNRLEQVFVNLLINARDAIEKKWDQRRGKDEAKTDNLEDKSVEGLVTIEVTDNGTGIPEAILDKIFEPFFTTKKVGKGTGLGLSISYGIVHDYDGTIEVESIEGEGATFIITFPRIHEA